MHSRALCRNPHCWRTCPLAKLCLPALTEELRRWLTSPQSIGAASSHRRKISVILSLLPRWLRVCPWGRALVESFSSRARSAREALVRQRSRALVRQRSRAWVRQRSRAWVRQRSQALVRQRSQALVRQRSRTTRAASERRELMAESRRRPLAASVGAPTVTSVGAPTVTGVGAPTVTSVGAPTVAPRSLSQNSNAGPTPTNARAFGQAVCHRDPTTADIGSTARDCGSADRALLRGRSRARPSVTCGI